MIKEAIVLIDFSPSHLKRKCQLTEISERAFCAGLKRHEEHLFRIVRADLFLQEQEVLQLEEACETDVSANRVNLDVDSGSGPEIVIGKLADHGIGLLQCE